MSKDVQHAVSAKPSKVLVNLEEFASLRGGDMIQNLYFLVLGFNYFDQRYPDGFFEEPRSEGSVPPDGEQPYPAFEIDSNQHVMPPKIESLAFTGNQMIESEETLYGRKAKYSNSVSDFFYAWTSPVYQIIKERVHKFPHGLPLFYGTPDQVASIYLAVFQLNPEAKSAPSEAYKDFNNRIGKPPKTRLKSVREDLRNAVKALQKIDYIRKQREMRPTVFSTLAQTNYDQRKIEGKFEQVRKAFSRLIKVFENLAIEADHQIRYTNVFTIREEEHWLEGGYTNWGDQRIALKINVDVS